MNKNQVIRENIFNLYPKIVYILPAFSKKLGNPNLTIEKFIEVLSKSKYNLGKELGLTANQTSKLLKEIFHDRSTNTTGTKVCNHIFSKLDLKFCCHCEKVLPLNLFRKKSEGNNIYCKYCHSETTKVTQSGRQAKYKCTKSQRTMPWTEYDLISEFYDKRPEGYHVDHIVPLNGTLVSGLHVLSNLQYLPAKDNCAKGNKFIIK